MVLIWSIFVFQTLFFYLIKNNFINNDSFALIWVLINLIAVIIILLSIRESKKIKIILVSALLIRIILLGIDIYLNEYISIPNSGVDSEGFMRDAIAVSNNLDLIYQRLYGGRFSKLIGILFHFGPESRIYAQYINVLLGLSILLIMLKLLNIINVSQRIKVHSILIIAFFPQAIIFSGIFLREVIVAFFTTLSVVIYIQWYKYRKLKYWIIALVILGLANIFHSGTIFIAVGYLWGLLFIENDTKTGKSFIAKQLLFAVFIVGAYVVVNFYPHIFLGKFQDVFVEDLSNIVNTRTGNSAYLTWINTSNLAQSITLSPLLMVYFLFSPLPLDWRGLTDLSSFLLDSSFYIYMIFFLVKNFKNIKYDKQLVTSLLIGLAFSILMFSLGVKNAGTAIRHRHKLFPSILIVYTIVKSEISKIRLN